MDPGIMSLGSGFFYPCGKEGFSRLRAAMSKAAQLAVLLCAHGFHLHFFYDFVIFRFV